MNAKRLIETLSLEGKVALVTGAASGIGFGAAKILAEAGASVFLLDIDEIKGRQAEEEINGSGGKARFLVCDVTRNEDCRRAVEGVCKESGRVDILVNNAGIIVRKNVVDINEREWDLVLDVCLKGIYLLSHHAIPFMKEGGSIINISSGWGLKGGNDAAAYCAAKGGVVNLTRAMARDFGKYDIRVNCVCPGDIDTPMLRCEAAQLDADEEEFMKEAANRPLKRIGQPEDVANAILFFASRMSSWVTGSVLVVDGGGIA